MEVQKKLQAKLGKWCARTQSEQEKKDGFAGNELTVEFKDEAGVFVGRGESRWGCLPNRQAGVNNCHLSFVAVPSVYSDDSLVFAVPESNGNEYSAELKLSLDTFILSGKEYRLSRQCPVAAE